MCRRSEVLLVALSGSLMHSNTFIGTICNIVSYLDDERDGDIETCR
jgi:hypothetical protein